MAIVTYTSPGLGQTNTDTVPDTFAFTDQPGVAISTIITSDYVYPIGFNAGATITISGTNNPEYQINSNAWTNAAGTFGPGQAVRVRHESSAFAGIPVDTVLTIGTTSDTFTSTTSGVTGVIWETNFAQDGSYIRESTSGGWDTVNPPNGWTSLKAATGDGNGSGWHGQSTGGIGGSVAMRCTYPGAAESGGQQPTNALGKHLTGNISTGYTDIYIRYRFKFPDGFRIGLGNADSVNHWKWCRLAMNTELTGETENREDSYYVVWNFGGSWPQTQDVNLTIGASSAETNAMARAHGSVSGPRGGGDYFVSGATVTTQAGHFQSIGGGALEADTSGYWVNTPQDWHTVEFRVKCSTTGTSQDAIWDLWFDGVKQADMPAGRISDGSGAQYEYIVESIAKTNPAEITLTGHELTTGRILNINNVIGPTSLNSGTYACTVVDSNTVSLDGVDGTSFADHTPNSGTVFTLLEAGHFTGLQTEPSPGFNWFVLLDNMDDWNQDWATESVDNYIDFNDIVVATSHIGHTYNPTGDGS